ncbi:glycosyltransferase [Rathayibacter sp. AY1A7]|uniref:glycosyltransferase n=1 Tax=Rathayibacter sp. AY1A7 TaxID=2080524 RepID=UPI000CE8BDD8|nr:glycosyltransferase [Rathayibacter sp. AY1A7]PPF20054.1 hypothetical protein C5B95_09110 [Rathayibacter sp. AY1A7]
MVSACWNGMKTMARNRSRWTTSRRAAPSRVVAVAAPPRAIARLISDVIDHRSSPAAAPFSSVGLQTNHGPGPPEVVPFRPHTVGREHIGSLTESCRRTAWSVRDPVRWASTGTGAFHGSAKPEGRERLTSGSTLAEDWREGERTIVHVTESFGAGTASAISDYVAATPAFQHRLVYSPREDSPVPESAFASFAGVTALPTGHVARVRALRTVLAGMPGAVVHAHSSFGGAYARLAVRAGRRRPIVYTPHCYGFERRDLPLPARAAFRVFEGVLAFNTTVFAACSAREARLSRWPFSRAEVVHVPNSVPASLPPATRPGGPRPLRLVGAGRLSTHKDPRFFAEAVEAVRAAGHSVDATWIGGGEGRHRTALDQAGVHVTGWLSRDEALRRLGDADVYLHSAQWEGMPMAVLEAHGMGLALVVRDIPAFDRLGLPLVAHSPHDVASYWGDLEDLAARSRLVAAAEHALALNTVQHQSQMLERLYLGLLPTAPRRRKP